MPGRLSLWGAGQMLSTMFSQSTEAPGSYWLALIQDVAPTAYISGAELDEPEATGYARAELPNNSANWSNDSSPQVTMTQEDIAFITATEDWGPIRFWALCNASVDGFVYATGELATPLVVLANDTVVLGAGDLAIALGPFFTTEA